MTEKPEVKRDTDIDTMPLSKYVAFALCNEIREQSYHSLSHAQRCKRCMDTAIDGVPAYMARKPGLRGCEFVNRAFKNAMQA